MKPKTIRVLVCATVAAFSAVVAYAQTSPFNKVQVADRIRKVEDGVDEFSKYLETRGDDARSKAHHIVTKQWSDNATPSGKSHQHAGSSRSSEADKG